MNKIFMLILPTLSNIFGKKFVQNNEGIIKLILAIVFFVVVIRPLMNMLKGVTSTVTKTIETKADSLITGVPEVRIDLIDKLSKQLAESVGFFNTDEEQIIMILNQLNTADEAKLISKKYYDIKDESLLTRIHKDLNKSEIARIPAVIFSALY